MKWTHIVAHTRGGFDGVAAWTSAAWLWPRMRRVFPDAAACLLMPNHTHTFAPLDERRRHALRRVLQDHGRVFRTQWDLGPPQPVHSRAIARRTARYIWLNPVRAGMVEDPLLIRPKDAPPIAASFDAIAAASASALRCTPSDRFRKAHPCRSTFVGLAEAVGHPRPPALAAACGVSRRALPALRRRADPSALRHAVRCLLDPRLHTWQTPAVPAQTPRATG
ncbi:MAG: hypothetical protein ACE37F_26385 [Nannocystaceae bacterium]|nr:hypothetical protein [bacterium]